MRLTEVERQKAIAELTVILQAYPEGRRVVELQGTDHFHGERTLSPTQIRSCLKAIPGITQRMGGSGSAYDYIYWTIKKK